MKLTQNILLLALVAGAFAACGVPAQASESSNPAAESTTQGFLNALAKGGGEPIESLSPAKARLVLLNAQNSVKVKLPAVDVIRRVITTEGRRIKLVIVRPAGVTKKLPVFMFFHGGGWVLGDFPTHKRLVADLVAGSGAAAVFVDYDRSPEVRFPVAINQAYAATKYVASNGHEFNLDGSRLAVVGNSVGGNMAAVVSLMAKDKGGPVIRSQVLLWPVTDANFNNASYKQFKQGFFLSRSMMKWFFDSYVSESDRNNVYVSPLRASIKRLKGLPPALVQTAELDVLRDEGEAYAVKLEKAGVQVSAFRYKGMIHDFGLLNVLSDVPGTRSALAQAALELKKRLR